jgi:hypothetical protein
MPRQRQPKGILVDYGGTLVEEDFNPRAGTEWLLSQAVDRPPAVNFGARPGESEQDFGRSSRTS